MVWTAPRTWVVGEVVTGAIGNTHLRDNFRYLKGLDGTTSLEDIVALIGTAHGLILNVVTSANRPTGENGMIVYNSTNSKIEKYENGTWRNDLAYGGTLTNLSVAGMTTGDVFYADTTTSITRLAGSGSGNYLETRGTAGTAPRWSAPAAAPESALYVRAIVVV